MKYGQLKITQLKVFCTELFGSFGTPVAQIDYCHNTHIHFIPDL